MVHIAYGATDLTKQHFLCGFYLSHFSQCLARYENHLQYNKTCQIRYHSSLELHVRLGERPPSPPQIFRNRRWSSQRKKRLLFLARWMAHDEETSRGYKERKSHRLQWSFPGSCCSVSSKVSWDKKNASTFIIIYDFRHFIAMKTLLCFVIPILIPRYCWGETWYFSIAQCAVRYCISLNCTWSVNSAAHMWGNKPYDR